MLGYYFFVVSSLNLSETEWQLRKLLIYIVLKN
jgi:hypothetical protein